MRTMKKFALDFSPRDDRIWARFPHVYVMTSIPGPAESCDMPRRIGAWRILRPVGSGGMGDVFLASRDDAAYQRTAAIKILRGNTCGTDARERFLLERQILAGLEHPHIARMMDGGSTTEGAPYLVMEYVDGRPLLEYCRTIPMKERCRLFAQVCDAVAYAHQRLIVHRDLKPSNILVDHSGTPKLLDFGIAKLLGPDPSNTQTQTAAFTAGYASPEQLQGLPVTTATDVYALGSILFELLTGTPAHRVKENSVADLVKDVCDRDVAPPSKFTTERVPHDLDNIVLKAMSRDPDHRYHTAFDLAEDVRRFLEDRPVLARRRSWPYLVAKFVRRNVAVVSLIGILTVALSGSTAWSLHAAREARDQRATADRNSARLRELNHRLLFDVQASLDGVIGAMSARKTLVKTALDHFEQLQKEGGSDPSLLRDLSVAYRRIGDLQGYPRESHIGEIAGAIASYRRSLELSERLTRDWQWHIDRALTLAHLADTLQTLGSFDLALQAYSDCLASVPAAEGTTEQRVTRIMRLADAHQSRARLLIRMNRTDQARADESKSREYVTQGLALAPSHLPLLRSRINQRVQDADSLKRQKRFDLALAEADLAVRDAIDLTNRSGLLTDRFSLAHAYQVRSDLMAWEKSSFQSFETALRDIDLGIEQVERVWKGEPASKRHQYAVSMYLSRRARLLEALNRIPEASRSIEAARHLNESLVREHPDNLSFQSQLGYTLYRHGSILQRAGQEGEALAAFHRAKEAMKRGKNPQSLTFELASLEKIGDIAASSGKREIAERSYREGLRLFAGRRTEIPAYYASYEERVKDKVRTFASASK